MDIPPPPKPKQAQQTGPTKEFLETIARMRIIEERYTELNNKIELIEQNIIIKNKKTTNEIKDLRDEIKELKNKINEIEDNISKVINEIGLLARKEDIDVLKKYMEYWKPAHFVTGEQLEEELNRLKKDILEKKEEIDEEMIKGKHKKDYIK